MTNAIRIGNRVRVNLNVVVFATSKKRWTDKIEGRLVEYMHDHIMVTDEETNESYRIKWQNILKVELLETKGEASMYECEDKMVSHPDHYMSATGMEVIDVIESFTTDLNGIEATDTGNVIKYICRWKNKNGLQDLKKARWYLEHLINHVEKYTADNEMDAKMKELYNGLNLEDYEKANYKVTIKKGE